VPLNDTQIRSFKPQEKPYQKQDGDGLYLEIRPSGVKTWRYRYWMPDGKDGRFTIGDYPEITLAEARKERERVREIVRQGINPTRQRKQDKITAIKSREVTLRTVAEAWQEETCKEKKWGDKYRTQVRSYLDSELLAEYGDLPIKEVTSLHVLNAIKKVKDRGAPSIARLVQQWTGAIFGYANRTLILENYDPTYPIRGNMRLPTANHHPHLDATEIPGFLDALDRYQGFGLVPLAVRLLMLTFVRTQELRMAKWEQFDFDNQLWRVPAENMKMGDKHLVPLSRQALTLLEQIRAANWRKSEFLFPNMRRPDSYITATTINRAIEIMGYKGRLSGHGFRATAKTIFNEHGFDERVTEAQLAHMERNATKRAYDHAKYLPQRRELMQWWADYLDNCRA